MPPVSSRNREAVVTALGDHSPSPVFTEQQPARLLVRDGPRPPRRRPLPVLLQGCRGLSVLPLLRGRQLFQRPQPPVFSHWNHHSGFPAQMNHLVRAGTGGPSRLCGHTGNGTCSCRQSHADMPRRQRTQSRGVAHVNAWQVPSPRFASDFTPCCPDVLCGPGRRRQTDRGTGRKAPPGRGRAGDRLRDRDFTQVLGASPAAVREIRAATAVRRPRPAGGARRPVARSCSARGRATPSAARDHAAGQPGLLRPAPAVRYRPGAGDPASAARQPARRLIRALRRPATRRCPARPAPGSPPRSAGLPMLDWRMGRMHRHRRHPRSTA